MEDFVKIFKSPEGDVYHITLSEDSRVLSENIRETLGNVHVAGICRFVIFISKKLEGEGKKVIFAT